MPNFEQTSPAMSGQPEELFFADGKRVASLVILNLEVEEVANRGHSLWVCAGDSHAGFGGHVFDAILNLVLQLFHRGDAGRCSCVDQHGSVEITVAEQAGDVLEVFADLLPG